MKFRIYFFFSMFFIQALQVCAQDLKFKQIGIPEGLPHYYTEYVFEDSKGFLWVGSVAGLTRYDGVEMKTYTINDGLLSNNIITINEDKKGNIWVGTDQGVSRINKTVKSYELDGGGITQTILVGSKNEIYIANAAGTFIYNFQIDDFLRHPIMGNFYTRTLIEDDNGDIWFGGIDGLFKSFEDTVVQIVVPGEYKNYHNSIVSSLKDCFGNLWFGTGSGFMKYANNNLEVFDQNIGVEHLYIKLFQLKDSSYIFGTYGGGIVVFEHPKERKKITLGDDVARNTIHGIEQTTDGTIWLATGSKLHKQEQEYFDKLEIESLDGSSPLEIVRMHNGDLCVGTDDGLVIYNPKTHVNRKMKINDSPKDNYLISLFNDTKDSALYLGSYSGLCFRYKDNKLTSFGNKEGLVRGQAVFDIYKDKKENFWVIKNIEAIKYSKGKSTTLQIDTLQTMLFEVVEDKKGNLWFATGKGLYLYSNNQLKHIPRIDNLTLNQIRQLEIDNNGVLWMGSVSSGVFSYDPVVKKGKNYSQSDGLSSNCIQSLSYDKWRNTLWIGTINGVSQIELSVKSIAKQITPVNGSIGLECNVNSLFCDSVMGLIVGSNTNIYNYNPFKTNKNENLVKVSFESLKIFNSEFNFEPYSTGFNEDFSPENLVLPHYHNHLTFNYLGIEFNAPESITYSVKLEGFDSDWFETKSRSITYNNLSTGNYVFKVKAKNSDGFWSENYEYSFEISSPFYRKKWFYFLILSLVVLIVIVISHNRVKKNNQKAQIEKNIAQLELKALRAQMNPHFIFNILNNIQNFVVTNQVNKAVELLGDFAALIRNILNVSSEKTILLSKEIEFLKTYIELDLTQYPDKYEYDFVLDEKLDVDNLLVPPMLIQPFVENSILHGLMHREGLGKLKLLFVQNETKLICTVEDNGVGREKSKKLSINNHEYKSKAINISNDRINQFNKIDAINKYKITISDVLDGSGNCIGTRAKIEMPLTIKY